MRGAHPRHACVGGSSSTPDPLVLEIAAGHAPLDESPSSAPAEPHEAQRPSEPADPDDPPQIDDHLLMAAGEPDRSHAEHESPISAEAAVLELMARVKLPTLRALRSASLGPLRAAISSVTREQDPQLWAAHHVLLGGALRLRANRVLASLRPKLLVEAMRAFDIAYTVFATLKLQSTAAHQQSNGGAPGRHRPHARCVGERDGTNLIARAIAASGSEHTHLLERAVTCLRLVRAGADIKSWTWVSSTNNLACALTLLGNQLPARAGSAMLEEAARVLHEALRAHAAGYQREDRGATLVNLAEALLSMAERETPRVRMTHIERAFMASTAALRTVVPPELAWLVSAERRELE